MSHKKNRSLKFVEGLGFIALSVCSAVATVVLASVTVCLAMTIVAIPLAAMTAIGAGACVVATFVFVDRAGHKFTHAFEGDEYERRYYHTEIKPVSSHFAQHQKEQNNLSSTALNNQQDMNGSTKALFASASPKKASLVPKMDSISSTINDDEPVAKVSA